MPERLNGAVSKTVVPKGTVGSNPTLSATKICFANFGVISYSLSVISGLRNFNFLLITIN